MDRAGHRVHQASTINGNSQRDFMVDNKTKLDGPNVWFPSLAWFGASLHVLLPFRGYYDLVALSLGCAIIYWVLCHWRTAVVAWSRSLLSCLTNCLLGQTFLVHIK